MGIQDTTRHISWYRNGLRPSNYPGYGGGRAPDSSAEVITEAVSNGPFAGDNLKTNPWSKGPATIGLADMGTVSYTDVYVSSDVTGWIYGMNMHSNGTWTATSWNAGHEVYTWTWGQNKQDHNKWEWYKVYLYWQPLIHPGSLGGQVGDYSAPFSTYWK